MADGWRDYQEETAQFFESLGLEATTDKAVQGVRTSHKVDVFVKSQHVGFDVTWIVECKQWTSRVTKLHVLALREIVTDLGADRGILLSEAGFQSGAFEAATLTNVRLTSLDSLRNTARQEIDLMRLRDVHDHNHICKKRYWNLPKTRRIDCGLRPDLADGGYSATHFIDLVEKVLALAFRGSYPFEIDGLSAVAVLGDHRQFDTPQEVLALVEPIVADVEARLTACETELEV